MASTIQKNMNYQSPIYHPGGEFSFFLQRTTTNEIIASIDKLPAKTSPCDDNINNQIIKLAVSGSRKINQSIISRRQISQ